MHVQQHMCYIAAVRFSHSAAIFSACMPRSPLTPQAAPVVRRHGTAAKAELQKQNSCYICTAAAPATPIVRRKRAAAAAALQDRPAPHPTPWGWGCRDCPASRQNACMRSRTSCGRAWPGHTHHGRGKATHTPPQAHCWRCGRPVAQPRTRRAAGGARPVGQRGPC